MASVSLATENDGETVLKKSWASEVMSTSFDKQGGAVYSILDNGTIVVAENIPLSLIDININYSARARARSQSLSGEEVEEEKLSPINIITKFYHSSIGAVNPWL